MAVPSWMHTYNFALPPPIAKKLLHLKKLLGITIFQYTQTFCGFNSVYVYVSMKKWGCWQCVFQLIQIEHGFPFNWFGQCRKSRSGVDLPADRRPHTVRQQGNTEMAMARPCEN